MFDGRLQILEDVTSRDRLQILVLLLLCLILVGYDQGYASHTTLRFLCILLFRC